ncbi:MAG: hypothetical protein QNJ22_21185 [Desulfosarcinaceae bacterium]|nr:hypothetical protein [Desulfosarcinaceae bacterium]
MKRNHQSRPVPPLFHVVLTALMLLATAAYATASTDRNADGPWIGKIQGYSFVNGSPYYPLDASDPLVSAERLFVFVAESGENGFFLIDNVDREFLAAYVGQQVRLRGAIREEGPRKTILVDGFERKQGDQWRSEWPRWEWGSGIYEPEN